MHIPDYTASILEARRVARGWCIFHTVPLMHNRPTTILSKDAYGQPVIEIIFNESELRQLIGEARLSIEAVIPSISYDLESILAVSTSTATYVCRVMG